MINARLKIKDLPDDFKNLVVTRSRGNPFFIEEVINTMLDSKVIEYDAVNNEHKLVGDINSVEIPDNLQALVMSRIDRLDEKSKLTIKVASVIGRIFQYLVLKSIHPTLESEQELQEDLGKLENSDLTMLENPYEIEYLFKHVITRDVAYESLLFVHRKELHGKIAEHFEKRYKDELEGYYSLLAWHYGLTDKTDKKLVYFQKAAEQAEKHYANQEAIEYYQKLINLYDQEIDKKRLELFNNYQTKIVEYIEENKMKKVEECIAKAEELLEDIEDKAHLALHYSNMAHYSWKQNDVNKALDFFNKALTNNIEANEKECQAIDLYNLALTHKELNNTKEAKENFEKSKKLANELSIKEVLEALEELEKEL